jgi:hypothetical protein
MIFQTLSDGDKAVLRMLYVDFTRVIHNADGYIEDAEIEAKYGLLDCEYESNIVDGIVKSITELLENNITLDAGFSSDEVQYRASLILDKFDEKEQKKFLTDFMFIGKTIAAIDGNIDIRERAEIINYFAKLGWNGLEDHILNQWQIEDHRFNE